MTLPASRLACLLLAALAVLVVPAPAAAQAENERAFLLIAHPDMLDPAFRHTVVLAVRADDTGPIGVILNRPSTLTLREIFPDRPDLAGRSDPVFLGGPVEPDALLFAFRSASPPAKGLRVADDIYLSGYSAVLSEIAKHPENAAQQRFFSGFSSWAPGQLEDEIERGGWFTLQFDPAALFEMNPLTMYEELYRRASAPRIETSREPGPLRASRR